LSDQKRVIDLLLTDFFPDEPCAAGLDLCPPGYRIPALEDDIKSILSRGWSFLAEDMDQVVGVAICNVEDKNCSNDEREGIFPDKFLKLERFFEDLKSNCDLYATTERLLDLFILCTRSTHRGQGIAGQLVRAAIDGAKSEGIAEVFAMGLSNYSQRIFRNMDFNERASIDYADYKQARIMKLKEV